MPYLVSRDGAKIYYEETGTGRPLVFIHGWAMSGRVWHFQQELADSFRLITMDLRGHGHSSTAPDGYSLEGFVADVVALFEQLALTGALLVGWSMGAQVVLQAFSGLKLRLAGLLLVAGTPRFSADQDYPHGLPPVEVKGLLRRLKRDYQKTMGDFFRGMFAEGEPDHAQYQRIIQEIVLNGRSPEPAAALQSLQILAEADLRPNLGQIDCPVLLIHGSKDTICLPAASRYMARELPMARLQMIEGSGHAPFMARPAEFNSLVRGFMGDINGRD
jgi:pimeloyl-[acyl-carrier protein] methyl ester esterase